MKKNPVVLLTILSPGSGESPVCHILENKSKGYNIIKAARVSSAKGTKTKQQQVLIAAVNRLLLLRSIPKLTFLSLQEIPQQENTWVTINTEITRINQAIQSDKKYY